MLSLSGKRTAVSILDEPAECSNRWVRHVDGVSLSNDDRVRVESTLSWMQSTGGSFLMPRRLLAMCDESPHLAQVYSFGASCSGLVNLDELVSMCAA